MNKYKLNNYDDLDVSYKGLTSLDELPDGIITLQCNNNQLTSLPELSNSLTWLYCQENHIIALPKIVNSLVLINCRNNKIMYLGEMPDSLDMLFCDNNPLECLIPSRYLRYQDIVWLKNYYVQYIISYEGQKNILTREPWMLAELMKQVKLNKKISEEFSYLIESSNLNLI